MGDETIMIRYFPVYDDEGTYPGLCEVTQEAAGSDGLKESSGCPIGNVTQSEPQGFYLAMEANAALVNEARSPGDSSISRPRRPALTYMVPSA